MLKPSSLQACLHQQFSRCLQRFSQSICLRIHFPDERSKHHAITHFPPLQQCKNDWKKSANTICFQLYLTIDALHHCVPTCCKLNNFCDSSIGGIGWNVARSCPKSIISGPQDPQSHQVSIMSGRPASRGIMFDKQRPRTTTSETSPARRTRVWQVVIHQRWKPGRPKLSLAGAHREPPASSGYWCSNDL